LLCAPNYLSYDPLFIENTTILLANLHFTSISNSHI